MIYARIEQNAVVEYPVYEGDIRLRYSNVSFASPFQPPEEYVLVESAAPLVFGYTKNVSEGDPTQINGVWTQNWVITDASEEDVAQRINNQWSSIRADRNRRLADCDWTQLSDAPLTNVQTSQWALYRQSLRDITAQSDPFNIVWPVTP